MLLTSSFVKKLQRPLVSSKPRKRDNAAIILKQRRYNVEKIDKV